MWWMCGRDAPEKILWVLINHLPPPFVRKKAVHKLSGNTWEKFGNVFTQIFCSQNQKTTPKTQIESFWYETTVLEQKKIALNVK